VKVFLVDKKWNCILLPVIEPVLNSDLLYKSPLNDTGVKTVKYKMVAIQTVNGDNIGFYQES